MRVYGVVFLGFDLGGLVINLDVFDVLFFLFAWLCVLLLVLYL